MFHETTSHIEKCIVHTTPIGRFGKNIHLKKRQRKCAYGKFGKWPTTAPEQRRLLLETSTNYTDIAKATFTKGFVRLRPGHSNGTGRTQPDSYIGPSGIYKYAAKPSDLPLLSRTPVADGLVLLLDAGRATPRHTRARARSGPT